ncbi:hypothetical protein DPMN_162643 [Dreissena polymorpha]|uniref:RZ-type domain-containing protein n=2 Tax=Dreissena polymorpha TaxID=45954 RepID=A0A9D4ES11_DREPO|nr:hypothetical protein DPMN_162643 [Dreissena polymorpha]
MDQGSEIAGPFIALMKGDSIITGMFLPTMPEDNWEEIRDVLLAGKDGNLVVYACPNGHRYTIGECGRPTETSICPECQAEIGGVDHDSAEGNVRLTGQDSTQKGHILQKAVQGGSPRPERDLMPVQCAAIKLILHMAMFLGPVDSIKDIIHPNVEESEMSGFFMDHINANIEELQTILKCNAEDVVLLMHCVVNGMMLHRETKTETYCRLQTKGDRKQWENAFSAEILNGVFGNRDQHLKTLSHVIASDERLGTDPLKKLIYEVDNTENATDIPNNILEMRSAWCYRSPITLEHIRVQLDTAATNNRHTTLKHFLKEDYILKAVRCLPNILRLQRILLQRFRKRLDKADAKKLTVKHMKDDMHAGPHTTHLIEEFANAWDITRKNLEHYVCRTQFGFVRVPNEFSRTPIHDGTPLAVFLPATDGPGLCSYVMTHFLCHKQNEMMNVYIESERHSEIQKIAPMDIAAAHLISYDEDNDLMPLVLANCHYAFEVGVGTQIEYDLVGLERQVMDRCLFSKSLIDLKKIPMVDVMIYRTELTNKAVLERIAQTIPQAKLSSAIKTQIYDELRYLPDVCTSLQNLDIAISFLQITGGDSDKSLKTFMEESLQMGSTLLSQTACKSCELQHAQALWLLVSFQKSKIQIDSGQTNEETFETLPKEFLCDIPEDIGKKFLTYVRDLSSEKLLNMLEKLHEFLILQLPVRENTDDEDYVNNTEYSLFDGLDSLIEDEFLLASFPKEVMFKHSVHAWVMAYEELKVKTARK